MDFSKRRLLVNAASDFSNCSKSFLFRLISSIVKCNSWASGPIRVKRFWFFRVLKNDLFTFWVLLSFPWPFTSHFIINLTNVIAFVGVISVTVALMPCFLYGCERKWNYWFLFMESWILQISLNVFANFCKNLLHTGLIRYILFKNKFFVKYILKRLHRT